MTIESGRPWGVPKTKPRCPYCKVILVLGDTPKRQNADKLIYADVYEFDDGSGCFVTWYCTTCNKKLPSWVAEKVNFYWTNGGMRKKPGRKPKSVEASDESAA